MTKCLKGCLLYLLVNLLSLPFLGCASRNEVSHLAFKPLFIESYMIEQTPKFSKYFIKSNIDKHRPDDVIKLVKGLNIRGSHMVNNAPTIFIALLITARAVHGSNISNFLFIVLFFLIK